jgi:hypothetical protein
MPLDAVAQQYAQTLYLARLHELSKKYSARTAETAAALAKRGMYAHTAGQFHTEMTRVGIEHIEELTDARVDAFLTAYERAKVPIDNSAVAEINHAAAEVFDIQGKNLIAQARVRAGQSNAPAGVAEQLTGMIESAMSQIRSRVNYKLSALRSEAILSARSAPQREIVVPQPELTEVIAKPNTHRWTRGEIWTAVGAIATIAGLIVAILTFLHWDKRSVPQPNNPPSAVSPEKPVRKPLPVITAKNIVELRQLNQVEQIRETESGKPLSEIPPGSFGFALVDEVVDREVGLQRDIDVDFSDLPNDFEIHKLRDGTALLVTYVGPETFDRLREGLQPTESVPLYTVSWKEASNLAAVPLDRISCGRHRDFQVEEDGKIKFLSVLDCQQK